MSTHQENQSMIPDDLFLNKFRSSWTFNYKVSKDFSNLSPNDKFKNSYIIKRTLNVNKLFMTYLETPEMNSQYLEAEAIVVHAAEDKQLW